MEAVSRNTNIVLVGGGKMGEAMIGGWVGSQASMVEAVSGQNFTVVEPTAVRREYLEKTYGLRCVTDTVEVKAAEVVVLAVKPQVIIEVLEGMLSNPAYENCLFISIAAGVGTKALSRVLPKGARLVRVMPNLPLVVSAGATVVCGSQSSRAEDVAWVRELFAAIGEAEIIEEELIDVACALSGSGPAYVAAMIESLVRAGESLGLSHKLASLLALQTVYGTALQLKETGQAPAELREAVSSPGGTTVAALSAMEAAGLENVYNKGVTAAVSRAKELGCV